MSSLLIIPFEPSNMMTQTCKDMTPRCHTPNCCFQHFLQIKKVVLHETKQPTTQIPILIHATNYYLCIHGALETTETKF